MDFRPKDFQNEVVASCLDAYNLVDAFGHDIAETDNVYLVVANKGFVANGSLVVAVVVPVVTP